MAVVVNCPRCGSVLRHDAEKGSYGCSRCKVEYRGPSKEEALGKGPFRGIQHPRR